MGELLDCSITCEKEYYEFNAKRDDMDGVVMFSLLLGVIDELDAF